MVIIEPDFTLKPISDDSDKFDLTFNKKLKKEIQVSMK